MSTLDADDKEDHDVFKDAMRDVKPLPPRNVITPPRTPLTQRKKPISYEDPVVAPLSDFEKYPPLKSEDWVEFKREGIPDKILRKMRLGQYNVEAIFDLHGMRAEEAKESLYRFMLQCQKKGVTHLLLIHGKGRLTGIPILKNKLNHWLRQLDFVLAFCSAKTREGHSGAMYVLLKNQKGRVNID